MVRKLALVLSVGALLLVAQTAAAHRREVELEKAALSDVRAALFGDTTKPGLVNDKAPFTANFRGVIVTGPEVPILRQTIEEALILPPDSAIRIHGTIDGKAFVVKMDNSAKGKKTASIKGLRFESRQDAVAFLDTLKERGMHDASVRGFVEGRRVHGKIDDGRPGFEG